MPYLKKRLISLKRPKRQGKITKINLFPKKESEINQKAKTFNLRKSKLNKMKINKKVIGTDLILSVVNFVYRVQFYFISLFINFRTFKLNIT